MNILLTPFAWLLTVFYNFTGSYGVAIILFAVVVKLVTYPFTLKGKKSMIKMNLLSGQQAKLQKMYGNNKEKYQQELQKLYEKEKVSPMGGCLWTLIPFFILIPLYAILREPMTYMMNMSTEQVVQVGNSVLNWAASAWGNGAALTEQTAKAGCNQLYLASLLTPDKVAAAQAIAPDAMAVNFQFLGLNMAQVPQWKFWTQSLIWANIGLTLMPILSAILGFVMSKVSQYTNNLHRGDAPKQNNGLMMILMGPVMSLWIGFVMPAGLCVYWIINNILSIVQELIASKMLEKDYAAAEEARQKRELLEKEEEKQRKAAEAAERARRAEEKKKNKGKKAPKSDTPAPDSSASRVGIRAYARGRAYDPDRFGGVTPYRDPNDQVDEDAIETARAEKAERREKAREEAEIEAAVEAAVDEKMAELSAGTVEDVKERLKNLPQEDETEEPETAEETPAEAPETPAEEPETSEETPDGSNEDAE